MAQPVKALATKPSDLVSVPRVQMVGKNPGFCESFSDLDMQTHT